MYPIITNSGANYGWLLTPNSGRADRAWFVDASGSVRTNNYVYGVPGVVPTLYLNANEYVESGNGTIDNPYRIK